MSNAAEKISDFFNVSLSELETNIVANAVKFNTQPSRLLDVHQFKDYTLGIIIVNN